MAGEQAARRWAARGAGDLPAPRWSLTDGLIDGEQVVCPLHNHAFRLADGHCTTGERPVQIYQVAVEDGEIVLRR